MNTCVAVKHFKNKKRVVTLPTYLKEVVKRLDRIEKLLTYEVEKPIF